MFKKISLFMLVACLAALMAMPAFAAEKKLKVGFLLLETIDDQGWTTAHYKGIEHVKKVFGDSVEISYTENVFPPDAERVLRNYASQGYDLIFSSTFGYMDATVRVAKDYPDIIFEHCSGFKSADNMGNYFVRMYQAEYLAGYAAGLMGHKNVGTVATHPIPEVIRGINAFTLGLTRGLEESGTEFDADKINTVVWLKSFRDAINETTLAETLIARGHDLIRQMADTPDSSLAACAAGTPAVGYGADAAEYGADCAIVSSIFNWGPYYEQTIRMVLDGKWEKRSYWKGFDGDGVKMASWNPGVPADVRAKVEAVREQFAAGNEAIFSGPLFDKDGAEKCAEGNTLNDVDKLTMNWLIKGVSGSVPQ